MKECFIQVRKTKNIDIDRNQNSKMKIVDSTFRKYIEITLSRFNSKCSMLVNQIEEMKREFNAQIEGMSEFLPTPYEKVALPYVSPYRKTHRLSSDNSTTKIDNNNSQEPYNESERKSKQFIKNPLMKNERNEVKHNKKKIIVGQTFNIDNKISLKLKGTRETRDQLPTAQINETDEKNNCINTKIKTRNDVFNNLKNIQSNKFKTIIIIANLLYLPYEDRIKLKFLNRVLFKEISSQAILSSSKISLENQLEKLVLRKHNQEFSSQTIQSILNCVQKDDDSFKNMHNKQNVMFYKLIYILLNQTIPDQISYEHLYENVLKVHQVQSIKQLFLNVFLKHYTESSYESSDVLIDQFLSVIQESSALISQKDLLPDNSYLASFSFCLKEFYHLFLFEKQKREEITHIKKQINLLEHLFINIK